MICEKCQCQMQGGNAKPESAWPADAPHDAQFMWDGRFYNEDDGGMLYMFDRNKRWTISALGSKHRLLNQASMIDHGKPTILFKPK